jgi:hypothetical protein
MSVLAPARVSWSVALCPDAHPVLMSLPAELSQLGDHSLSHVLRPSPRCDGIGSNHAVIAGCDTARGGVTPSIGHVSAAGTSYCRASTCRRRASCWHLRPPSAPPAGHVAAARGAPRGRPRTPDRPPDRMTDGPTGRPARTTATFLARTSFNRGRKPRALQPAGGAMFVGRPNRGCGGSFVGYFAATSEPWIIQSSGFWAESAASCQALCMARVVHGTVRSRSPGRCSTVSPVSVISSGQRHTGAKSIACEKPAKSRRRPGLAPLWTYFPH